MFFVNCCNHVVQDATLSTDLGIKKRKGKTFKCAQAESEGKTAETKKPIVVKYGLNHITYLIEENKAQVVIIAHDVDPIELVVCLPTLWENIETPHCSCQGKI